jgi:alpha-D-xyloside xylohydrolase
MTISTKKGFVEIDSPIEGIINVRIGPPQVSPIGIVLPGSSNNALSREDSDSFSLSTGKLKLTLNKNDGNFLWESSDGKTLLSQPFPELSTKKVIKYLEGSGSVKAVKTVDGERNFTGDLVPVEDRTAYRAKLFFRFKDDEALHGLGQAEEGIYDYRFKQQYLYQHNMRIPIPFLISSRLWGLLVDCGCLMTFNGEDDVPYLSFDTLDALDFYFIHDECLDGIIGAMRRLSGKAALLPKWAFGYIQSREAYRTQEELVGIAREYRRRRIPLDCVVQDWNTWEPGKWGNKRLDKSRYPDIGAANRELHDLNVHSMVSIWPNISAGEDHDEMAASGNLLLDNATYNAFDENAKKLYWKQAARELFSGGFDSWWCDSTEPFTGPDWCGPVLRKPWERYCLVGDEHKKYLDAARANCYALEHAKGIYQNQRAENSEKRVFILTRSGWAGSQRWGAALWSGDISAKWETIRKQISEGLNLCMSGLPWWTVDIGGFFVVRENWQNRGCGMNQNSEPLWFWQGDFEEGTKDMGYRELYLRWLQFACFLPLFRSHGTDFKREIWNFGERGELFYDSIEAFIRLRYQLMPYIYSLAGMVHFDNYTMMRSLLFDFIEDEKARNICGEFMFGPAFLVCPVTSPMRFGPGGKVLNKKEEWPCYLPGTQNTLWHDFWTGEIRKGGMDYLVSAPLERMPLFVRGGSIVPMETAPVEHTGEISGQALEVRIYSGADGEFTIYEDSGDGYAYEEGKYNRIKMSWNDSERIFSVFSKGDTEYDFPQSVKNRPWVICAGPVRREILYSGKTVDIRL